MSLFDIASTIVVLCALFAYANYKLLKLPAVIGAMIAALLTSLGALGLGELGFSIDDKAREFMQHIDFNEAVLHGMLSFLLFAGALHVNLEDLARQKWVIASLAFFGTLISTGLVAVSAWYLFSWLGTDIPFIYALLFGALISPTDPVAVLSILRKAGLPITLQTKIVGESLFNDGIGVVIFIVLLGVATGGHAVDPASITMIFVQEALGGVVLGFGLGYITYKLLSTVDSYVLEILLTLALVMGGYSLAFALHTSGPIAMVVAGLLIGNHGRSFAMSDTTREHIDTFWELIDELLNVALFVMLGMELLILDLTSNALLAGVLSIGLVLLARFLATGIPVSLLKLRREFSPHVVRILTWGGLRGGISVALALSLPHGPERDFLLVVTYCIVVFSIVVQGLTLEKVVKRQ